MGTSTNDIINVALIGDGYVGKTCVLNCLQKSTYSRNTAPNVYNEMTLEKIVNDKKILFKIIDTAGQEEYDHIRKEVYEKNNLYVTAYSVRALQDEFNDIRFDGSNFNGKGDIASSLYHKNGTGWQAGWLITTYYGTKVDLRINAPSTSISKERGVRLQKRIGAKYYVECSSKSGNGISDIIEAASSVLFKSQHKKSCAIQ